MVRDGAVRLLTMKDGVERLDNEENRPAFLNLPTRGEMSPFSATEGKLLDDGSKITLLSLLDILRLKGELGA